MIPIPSLKFWAAGILAALCFAAGYGWRDNSADAELAKCEAAAAQTIATMMRAAAEAEKAAREREAQIAQSHQETIHAAIAQSRAASADADRVRAALERLRVAAASAARGGAAAADPAAATPGPTAGPADDLPPDVLVRLGRAAGELAAAADTARIAGLACERAYAAVTDNPP